MIRVRCHQCGMFFKCYRSEARKRYCSQLCRSAAVKAASFVERAKLVALIHEDYLAGVRVSDIGLKIGMTTASLSAQIWKAVRAGQLPHRSQARRICNSPPIARPHTLGERNFFEELRPWPGGLRFEDARVRKLRTVHMAMPREAGVRSSLDYSE